MTFNEAVQSGFGNYIKFSGRAARSEYWYWTLFTVILTMIGGILDQSFFDLEPGDVGPMVAVIDVALFFPSLGVFVRRLHDVGRSGWWFFIILVPLLGWLLLLYWMIKKGDEGDNAFGPSPLALMSPASP